MIRKSILLATIVLAACDDHRAECEAYFERNPVIRPAELADFRRQDPVLASRLEARAAVIRAEGIERCIDNARSFEWEDRWRRWFGWLPPLSLFTGRASLRS